MTFLQVLEYCPEVSEKTHSKKKEKYYSKEDTSWIEDTVTGYVPLNYQYNSSKREEKYDPKPNLETPKAPGRGNHSKKEKIKPKCGLLDLEEFPSKKEVNYYPSQNLVTFNVTRRVDPLQKEDKIHLKDSSPVNDQIHLYLPPKQDLFDLQKKLLSNKDEKYYPESNLVASNIPRGDDIYGAVAGKTSEVVVYYQNTHSIRCKEVTLYDPEVDIYAVTETWFDNAVEQNIWIIDSFSVFRDDREYKRGGGVLIAIKKTFPATRISVEPIAGLEMVCVSVKFGNNSVIFVVVYIPPISSALKMVATMEEISERVRKLSKSEFSKIVILGDFNSPALIPLLKPHFPYSIVTRNENRIAEITHRFLKEHQLTNINYIPNDKNRILDLILIKNLDPKLGITVHKVNPISNLDILHPALRVSIPY